MNLPLQPNLSPVQEILWHDPKIYQQRYQKSVVALAAVREVINTQAKFATYQPEFETLCQTIQQIDPQYFTTVWSDPAAQHWLRVSYELVKAISTGQGGSEFLQAYSAGMGFTDFAQLLPVHLAELKRFIFAMFYLAGNAWTPPSPYVTCLPMVISGTPVYLDTMGDPKPKITISALSSSAFTCVIEGVEHLVALPLDPTPNSEPPNPNTVTLQTCPVVEHQGYRLPLQPYVFQIPGLGYGEPVLAQSLEFQNQYLALVEQSLALIHQFQPSTYQQITEFVKVLALKPLTAGTYSNISDADLPGAFICSIYNQPLELADTFIHEFHHNRLFFLEDQAPILADLAEPQVENYYSPWRDDLRPLRGLLHATYVYTPVWHYWYALYQNQNSPEAPFSDSYRYITSQVVKIGLQLQIGVAQLRAWAKFTEFGQPLFEQLSQDIQDIQTQLQQAGIEPAQTPALVCRPEGMLVLDISKWSGLALSVQAAITEHVQQFDLHNQVDLDTLNLSHP
jgi:hypothetical protein